MRHSGADPVNGTVNIARSLFLDEAFKDQPFTEREAFMWMVMEASWKDRTKRVGSVVVDLKRGQLAASIRFMADAWGWEKSTVDRFLKRLEKRDMIGTDSGTGLSVITIRKYNEYQGGNSSSGTGEIEERDSSGTASGQTRTPEAIPEKKEPIGSKKKEDARGSRLSPEWFLPRDLGEWALSEGMTRDEIRSEADKFRDYWIGVPGARGRKSDWPATWRNWVRKFTADRAKGNGNGNRISGPTTGGKRADPALEQIARLAGLGAAPGDGRSGVGGFGEEAGPLWMGTRPQ